MLVFQHQNVAQKKAFLSHLLLFHDHLSNFLLGHFCVARACGAVGPDRALQQYNNAIWHVNNG
jgi:hypothetical protein